MNFALVRGRTPPRSVEIFDLIAIAMLSISKLRGLACMYREKVAGLAKALNDPGTSVRAAEVIRSLLSEIRLIPEGETLIIELVGELAGLLSLQDVEQAKTRGVSSGRSIEMVAGVGFEPTTFRL